MPPPFFPTFPTISAPSTNPSFGHSYKTPLLDPTHQYAMRQLKQTGSVSEYMLQFETISLRVLCMSDRDHLDCFISGLRDDISHELRLRRPYSLSHAIGLAKEIEATFNLPKPLEITKIHSPCVIQPPSSKFHVSVKAPTVTGGDGTAQSQGEDNLSGDLIFDVANDRTEFLPEVFKDSELSIPVPVPSQRVLTGFETHSTDLSPVLVPPLLDVVPTIGFNPQALPAESASRSPKERNRSSAVTEQWAFDTPVELTPTEIPPPEPPDSVSVPTSLPHDQEGYRGTKLSSVVLHTIMQSSFYDIFNEMATWSIKRRDSLGYKDMVPNGRMETVGFQHLGHIGLMSRGKQESDALAQCLNARAQLLKIAEPVEGFSMEFTSCTECNLEIEDDMEKLAEEVEGTGTEQLSTATFQRLRSYTLRLLDL